MGSLIDDETLLARAYLSRVAEPGGIPVWDWVRCVGPVAAAEAIRSGQVSADVAAATDARRRAADPEADLEAARRHHMRLLVPQSPDWPHFALAALGRTGRIRAARFIGGQRKASTR